MQLLNKISVEPILNKIPTGNPILDKKIVDIIDMHKDDNNTLSMIIELSILSALYNINLTN